MRYVLPRYKVDIKTDNTFYGHGSPVHVDVKAIYFAGDKPVADAKVTLTSTDSNGLQIPLQEKRTNADGSASFDVQLPPGQSNDGQVSFQASVDDGGRVPQTARAAVRRQRSSRPHRGAAGGGTLVEGVPNKVYFLVTQADGRPLPLKLTADGLGTLQCDAAGVASALVRRRHARPARLFAGMTTKAICDRRDVELLSNEIPNDFLVRTDKAVYLGDGA